MPTSTPRIRSGPSNEDPSPKTVRHTAAIFLTLVILWALVAEANHALSGLRVYLFVGGLFMTYAALMLPWRAGLASSLLGGLLCDANSPVAFGTHLILYAAAFAIIVHLRERLPRDDTIARLIVALLTNLALFLLFLHADRRLARARRGLAAAVRRFGLFAAHPRPGRALVLRAAAPRAAPRRRGA
jgi:rod shape-determining protein MreD